MNLQEANNLIERADKLFRRASQALDRGNNSQDKGHKVALKNQCDACRERAEKLLEPLGIVVDYPGLYPCFQVAGMTYHTTESAVSAALEKGKE